MKRFLIFAAALILLLGYYLFPARALSGFVTHADISWQTGLHRHHRHYNQPEKIQKLLHYIRALRPRGNAATDPEALGGNRCKIVFYYQNGQRQIYYLQADRYLSIDAHPWERVNPQQSAKLYRILEEMTSDLP